LLRVLIKWFLCCRVLYQRSIHARNLSSRCLCKKSEFFICII